MNSKNYMNITEINWKIHSLLPCVVQDSHNNEVLMLAYMNEESLNLTLKTRVAHYFSRSKQRIWKKGEQSGHIQEVCEIFLDCDNDSVLLKVIQHGFACHTGNKTCFFKEIPLLNSISNSSLNLDSIPNITNPLHSSIATYGALDTLYHILLDRKGRDPKISYTASLFAKGDNAIAKKIIEESSELCFAFKDKNNKEIIYECADVLYHIFVALAHVEICPDRIYQELIRRMSQSGIEEKNSRKLDKS